MYKIISSNSKGNSVLYHNSILVDIGVPFVKIKPYLYDIQIVLLTHEHKDHINISTLRKLMFERPSVRIGCCDEWFDTFQGRKVDRFTIGQWYKYGAFEISPVQLYHDVPNCGYRIIKDNYKIFHATDSAHLNGIEAKEYDLYAIEHNYNEDTIHEQIAEIKAKGGFAYQDGAINSHLSEQQARDFIYKNKGEKCEVLRLHESDNYE